MRRRSVVVLLGLLIVIASCQGGSERSTRSGRSVRPPHPPVYVALGGDETMGAALDNRLGDAWPQVLYRGTLPKEAVFYNLARRGGLSVESTPGVLDLVDELKPTLATLWLNSTDEQHIADIVQRLRRAGATRVLVADTNDVVARVAGAEGATVVDVPPSLVSADDHRAVAAAFAAALSAGNR